MPARTKGGTRFREEDPTWTFALSGCVLSILFSAASTATVRKAVISGLHRYSVRIHIVADAGAPNDRWAEFGNTSSNSQGTAGDVAVLTYAQEVRCHAPTDNDSDTHDGRIGDCEPITAQ